MRLRFFTVLGVLFFAGCGIETTQPLSDPLTAEADESLYGHWLATVKDKGTTREIHAFVGKHVVENNPDSIAEALLFGWNPATFEIGNVTSNKVFFTVSKIGKSSYINVFDVKGAGNPNLSESGSYKKWAGNENRKCLILRYFCNGKELRVWTAKDKSKKLELLTSQGQLKVIDGIITIESMVKYLRKNGGEFLFDDEIVVFRKVP